MLAPRLAPAGGCLVALLFALSAGLAGAAPAADVSTAKSTAATPAPQARLPLKELRTFVDVFEHIRDNYVDKVDDRTLLENAIKGMLTGLDPHSAYLDSGSFDTLKMETTGEFGGLGLEVGMDDGFVRVISPIDGTPAERAGVEPGDMIVRLDGKPVRGMSLDEAIGRMRGPSGSKIRLTIMRKGLNHPLELTLTRATIKVTSVRGRLLAPGYGYLRIAQFQTRTGHEMVRTIKDLEHDGPLKGLVLDLRNNPGGILQSSVDVADTLLDKGLIVYTKGRIKSADVDYRATAGDLIGGAPVVVLINGGTASASEIVAGALQDHHRAVIMGTRSFGKGSVQTVLPIAPDKAIKLTTALYFTPSGRSIQAQGIKPDIVVKRAKIEALPTGDPVTEADLDRHLHNVEGGEESDSAERRAAAKGDQLLTTDNQLYEALSLLKGINILSRNDADSAATAPDDATGH